MNMNNEQKNTYVKKRITAALLALLKEKPLSDISVSELTGKAEIGRVSFYRNYQNKEDILKEESDRLVGPANYTWSCFGVGHSAMEMLYGATALGGHIRVGMEDNVLYSKGVLADSNVQFVERAVRVVKEFGREVATPDEARQLLHLAPYND